LKTRVVLPALGLVAAMTLALLGMTSPAQAGHTATSVPGAVAASAAQVGDSTTSAKKKKKRYKVRQGAIFNNPRGGTAGRYRIEREVLDVLRHTLKGEHVRIALYSFDRIPVANAIVAAHRRGVHIQMLLNDHWENRAMKIVRAALGNNVHRKSFIYKCKSGCRTTTAPDRNLHTKFYTFTKAGKSEDVLLVGSANFTRNAAVHQWNDLYFTSGNAELFDQFVDTFKDMKKDYRSRQPPMYYCGVPKGAHCDDSVDKYTNWVFPKRSTRSDDVVLHMLDKIQCLTPDGNGGQTRTHLALNMHTMRGNRGDYLAAAIRQKFAEGCDFRVSYGLIGYQTKKILGAPTARGRIPLRSSGFDYNTEDNFDLNNDGDDDLILDRYSHQKYFIIQGTYNGIPNYSMVLTGSSNWASLGTAQDEVFFTIRGAANAKRYLRNFNFMWRPGNSRNAYTTTYENFRVARKVVDDWGRTRTVYVTERRPVTTVERDPYRAGGRYWEGD
jgi:hypothetical protein